VCCDDRSAPRSRKDQSGSGELQQSFSHWGSRNSIACSQREFVQPVARPKHTLRDFLFDDVAKPRSGVGRSHGVCFSAGRRISYIRTGDVGFIRRTAFQASRPGLDNWGATHRISGLARRPTALRPLDCSRLRRSHVLSSVSMHFDAIFGEPRRPTSAISYIRHSKMKTL
jgi:hypothetical protein